MTAYLFTYFISEGEDIRYALSRDAYTWYAVNDNKPVVNTAEISSTGGVRDPHILRGADGKTFYMVVTDLHTNLYGWGVPNTGMVLLKSDNLTDWQWSKIDIPETYEQYSDMGNIWAPQVIYDPVAGKYMVYFSMTNRIVPAQFYYAYTNDNFTAFEDVPQPFFANPNGNGSIDADIIEKDGRYHLFFKSRNESRPGIMKAVSNSVNSGYEIAGERLLNPTESDVEGSSVFKLISSDEYILMYDVFREGRYQFTKSTDLLNFEVIDEDISMNFHPRHGTVMPVTEAEVQRIIKKWGITTDNF